MAELSKIKFNGTEYDLKDAIAREAIENLPDTSTFMVKGTDYVTAGQKSGTTLGTKATAEGDGTIASGPNSHAEGTSTTAYGQSSHAEGGFSEKTLPIYISGEASTTTYAVSSGITTLMVGQAVGFSSQKIAVITAISTENNTITVSNTLSETAINNKKLSKYLSAYGQSSHAEGIYTTASGISSHAEGCDTTAKGAYSHAEGLETLASGDYSHAEGRITKASGYFAHAEGYSTTASGYSHAEGHGTTASGNGSHAEGYSTTASGNYSHAEGYSTTASGNYSHTEGYNTTAQCKSQHIFGEYNILDTTGSTSTRGAYVEIVGKGTSNSARSNARTLDWSGNETLAGKLTMGASPTADMDAATKQYVDTSITTAIGGINQFEVAIVSDLPTSDINTHTIYFKSNSSSGNNIYDEYMYINSNWELIGSTQIDLTPYALSANLATVATSGSYADLLNAPVAETDTNVEDMLDSFNLDYTSNTSNPNYAAGVSF